MKKFDSVFKALNEVFEEFDKTTKGIKRETVNLKSGLMNHVLCHGNCGVTVFKFPGKTLLRNASGGVVYCSKCASGLKLPLLKRLRNWWGNH